MGSFGRKGGKENMQSNMEKKIDINVETEVREEEPFMTMGKTKAGMLLDLKGHVPSLNILPVHVVHTGCFPSSLDNEIRGVLAFAKGKPLIVRSSSRTEDTLNYSNAGRFKSELNVPPIFDSVREALLSVWRSYDAAGENEEILVQPMLQGLRKSGVVFTADMDTFADYYTVNYFEGEDTSAVTSGSARRQKTFVRYRGSPAPSREEDMERLIEECQKIENYLGSHALDIEFAIDVAGQIYILQVRPIARGDKDLVQPLDLAPVIDRIYRKVEKLSKKHPFLLGHTTAFGVMPDWNPAEMLGARPKKLAISLYKELITDSIWAHQRYNYGYRDLTMHPLMASLCGVPYIDTRITFNSFIPKGLNDGIAEKLADYYLDRLAKYPRYHDKVEFEIVFSCYYFGLPDDLKKLNAYGFNENELAQIEAALRELTNRVIDPATGLCRRDIEKVAMLEENYEKIERSDISLVDKIFWLIEECKAYGTLPFAGVARSAFIAVQFLRSFVACGLISEEQRGCFMNSLKTVNKTMDDDFRKLEAGTLSRNQFLERYGHVRPGTYDITSKRYDEAFDTYFPAREASICESVSEDAPHFEFPCDVMEKLNRELKENGLLVTAEQLMRFIREAIEGRERLKFVFTKSVSRILQLIGKLGERVGIQREDMAHLDISLLQQLYVDLYAGNLGALLLENIQQNKRQYRYALQIRLPGLILSPENCWHFHLLEGEPNFITQRSIISDVVVYSGREELNLKGKIVFLPAADPGYDFLFLKEIGGLVTQFGGANSHMAVRCAELGIPAVIGTGEGNYTEWSRSRRLSIDCMKKQVIRIE